jgi:hypothetical protein
MRSRKNTNAQPIAVFGAEDTRRAFRIEELPEEILQLMLKNREENEPGDAALHELWEQDKREREEK